MQASDKEVHKRVGGKARDMAGAARAMRQASRLSRTRNTVAATAVRARSQRIDTRPGTHWFAGPKGDPKRDPERDRTGREPRRLPPRRQRDPGNEDEIPERRDPPPGKPGQNDRQPRHAD